MGQPVSLFAAILAALTAVLLTALIYIMIGIKVIKQLQPETNPKPHINRRCVPGSMVVTNTGGCFDGAQGTQPPQGPPLPPIPTQT